MRSESKPRPVRWVGSSREDLREFPEIVKDRVGFALFTAQTGGRAPQAKPMRGFGGAGVLEIVDDYDGDTFRTVYVVRFADSVYVLHCFQKKSKHGIATPKRDVDLVRARLSAAREDYEARQRSEQ